MSKIRETVIAMLKTPQLANMASITLDGKPWTRYIMIQSDAEFNLRSAVCLQSRKIKQIEKNPEVHLAFGINNPQDLRGSAPGVGPKQSARHKWDAVM